MASVTGTRQDYVGSITIDKHLMDESGLYENEKVIVANINNGYRLETYVIPGGDGQIELNGAAANHASVGDRVIVMGFAHFDETEMKNHKPTILILDEKNQII